MITTVSEVSLALTQVLADSGSSEDGSALAFVFLLAGPAFYAFVYLRYRNTDKRHKHEVETEASLLNVQVTDVLVKKLRGVSHSKMKGANHREVRGSRHGLF